MQDKFFKSIDNEIRMQIAHRIIGVPADRLPGYYGLVEFAVKKEKEILAERQQHKESTHQTSWSTSIFQKPNWPAQKPMPSARMVAPAPEEDDYLPSAEQSGREDSVSRESYAVNDEPAISTVEDGVSEIDLKVILRVAHIMEDMNGKCFHCGQEGHRWRDSECPMYNPNHFLNQQEGSVGSKRTRQVPDTSSHSTQKSNSQNRG